MSLVARLAAVSSVLAACALLSSSAATASAPLSLGTLLRCAEARCLWADGQGGAVSKDEMIARMLHELGLSGGPPSSESKRLGRHAEHIEAVFHHANQLGLTIAHRVGITHRHAQVDYSPRQPPHELVNQELDAQRRRRLEGSTTVDRRALQDLPEALNWCSKNNPLLRSVCSPVKSQSSCGSCWSFAASDAIETATAVQANTSAVALSPQQFLDCSRRRMTATFSYCWASSSPQTGSAAGWLQPEMKWASTNNGCDGGMTHAAFTDAAQLQLGLVSELALPYAETKTDVTLLPSLSSTATNAPRSEAERNQSCPRGGDDDAVATIAGWKQAVGTDCSTSQEPSQLLRLALQQQPISVAITSRGTFQEYKGGIYTCANNGDISDSAWLNHALVLVGYGSEDGVQYWILKNSFGSSWGERGFMRLRMDSKLNCGLNIFPVVPTGAARGSAKVDIDGGGAVQMLGLSPGAWIGIAVATTIATGVLTAVGVIVAQRARRSIQ